MKLSERVLDAMSGIDEKLLKDSEEYTANRKTFDLRILVMSAAVILLAILVIPQMPKNAGSTAPAEAVNEAAYDGEAPAEAVEGEEKSAETAAEYGVSAVQMTDELQKALQEEKEVTIIAEPAEELSEGILNDMCAELQEKGYEVSAEDGKLVIRTDSASFDTEDLPSGCAWMLDLYN